MKKKSISNYNYIFYNGNLSIDFYLFCLKKDFRLIRFFFLNILNLIISFYSKNKKDLYEIRKYRYLKYVDNLDVLKDEFYQKKKVKTYFPINIDLIIDRIPYVLLSKEISTKKNITYTLDANYDVKLEEYSRQIENLESQTVIYANNYKFLNEIDAECKYYVKRNKMKYYEDKSLKKIYKYSNILKDYLIMFILSLIVTCMSFCYAWTVLEFEYVKPYFEFKLFMMNFIPIFSLMVLFYYISKRITISYIILSLFTIILGTANQSKLLYRDDIVKFEDILVIKEAALMTERYDIEIKKYTIIFIVLTILITLIIKHNRKKRDITKLWQGIMVIVTSLTIYFGYDKFYMNSELYESLGDESLINKWLQTRQYQIRGMIYPFFYTIKDFIDTPPENYSDESAKSSLNTYKYENIPNDKKVNIIAIMLEAYNDFSKFGVINWNEDIYEKFHEIQSKSISGNIVTSIFGGGTVITERNFITGYYNLPSLRKNTNSYAWYFKEQGYRTEAMHPVYGAFYNRASVNPNLGFDIYYNYENRYSKVQEGIMWDDKYFFNDILSQYDLAKKDKVPYFNFSVTYQNHGPYPSANYENKSFYFENPGMSEEAYNTINKYFDGIYYTNESLFELVENIEKEQEPTILIFFGDHNPYLGENAKAYTELGINMDVSTVEGFENYYETPYVIYANDSAKQMFNKSFVGKGNTISPIFLMNELFDYIGLKGNEYLQYMSDLKKKTDIISGYYYKINGEFVPKDVNDDVKDYEKINYYVSRNFNAK